MSNAKIEKYQQELVDKLLEQMESNKDFMKSWSEIPFSPYNGKGFTLYNGINQINLSMDLVQKQSADPRYYTFKQIKDLDLKLKKGSKGVQVQFYRLTTKETKKLDKNGQTIDVQIPFIRLTHAFNAQDIEGLKPYEKTEGFAALKDNRDLTAKLNEVIKNSGMKISHGGNRAFYIGGEKDTIMMPPPERFSSNAAYAATLLHELAHSTGHSSRQNRDMGDKDFNRMGYAKEELRAELSSVFMCQRLGISYELENDQTHIENSAAYLKGWKNILKNDTNEFFKAARDANKITSFLVDGKSFERTLNKTNDKQTINSSEQQVNFPINEDFNNAVDLVWSGKFENMQALKKGLSNPASIAMDAPLRNIIHQSELNIKRNYIPLGQTPKILKSIGVANLPMGINYQKLFEIQAKHNLDAVALKKIPQQINNPAIIFKNKRIQAPANSFVILTELVDKNNKPIITAVHTNSKQGVLEINRIASIYGRNISQIRSALKNNELVYAHKQKSQLIMSRLQLHSSLLVDSVAILTNKDNKDIKSNKQTKQQSLLVRRARESKGRSK
ncbi:diguanylate cyclase/phosphodiesterase (GGDEF & EAL domains) with PAS/PAC sensor(s) [uncultured Gammaproteobacteria bacterium]|nr:diguanylate cyclase/phosphodiesterase (GGDEF & EAL domains) with PAS/PAC sensor(s) [uncultured Gammaproteobacteria bacterium]